MTFDADTAVSSVVAAGGRVVVTGRKLHTLSAGAAGFRTSDVLARDEWFLDLALEHRAPFRVAFTTRSGVFVVEDGKETPIAKFEPPTRGYYAMHVAWGGVRGASRLYIAWSDMTVMIADPETGAQRKFPFENIEALSSDADGVVAMVAFCQPPRTVIVRDDHVEFAPIQMATPDAERLPAEDAEWTPITSRTQARRSRVSLNERAGTYVRRLPDPLFRWCEPLATAGALAFEGSSPGAALFGAFEGPRFASVARVAADGTATRVCDVARWEDDEDAYPPIRS